MVNRAQTPHSHPTKRLEPVWKLNWVAQATGLCRPATRRTERRRHSFAPRCRLIPKRQPRSFRSASRRPGRASGPFHPFSDRLLDNSYLELLLAPSRWKSTFRLNFCAALPMPSAIRRSFNLTKSFSRLKKSRTSSWRVASISPDRS